MPNILSGEARSRILKAIDTDENRRRKNTSIKKMDVYQSRQDSYVRQQLESEYSKGTVDDMRVISSINLCHRIVNEQASLYQKPVSRNFYTRSGSELTDPQKEQLEQLYRLGMMDAKYKRSNRMFKLEDQVTMQYIPKDGVITSRVLLPHHFDVVPREDDPEIAQAYVLSVYDKQNLYNMLPQADDDGTYLNATDSDQINQVTGDSDDPDALHQRFIWWSDEYHFITNGNGQIIGEDGQPMSVDTNGDLNLLKNPIGKLPFVDIAIDREFEYWVRAGNDVVQFSIDYSVLLSDTAETNKRQAYSQAIVYSEEPPKDYMVGPHLIMHMKLDPNKELQPKFEWATPSPDMQASLDALEIYLRLFLSAAGQDPGSISGRGDTQKFSSGVERLLAMIQKFEASADDITIYQWVEQKGLDIMVLWSNLMQSANIKDGVDPLVPSLQQAILPDDVQVDVLYAEPQALQSKKEKEDSISARIDMGLISKKMALMELDGLTEEEAQRMLDEIDTDDGLKAIGAFNVEAPPLEV